MHPVIEQRRRAVAHLQKPGAEDFLKVTDQKTLDLIASFQRAVIDDLVRKTLAAASEYQAESLIVTGGVAANTKLREDFSERSEREGLQVHFPSRRLSTDNAAMIAAAAYPKLLAAEFADPEFSAEAALALGR
jgi:tRNA N6-adenosine threonylcarbamoyltransferase